MTWNERYPKGDQPELRQIDAYVASPLWGELRAWVEQSYGAQPRVEHSTCSAAPGWNVKYKKGRALCTLYPRQGYFIALVTVGRAEAAEAELALPLMTAQVREQYRRTTPMNGARWLMIDVADERTLADVKRLVGLRVAPRK